MVPAIGRACGLCFNWKEGTQHTKKKEKKEKKEEKDINIEIIGQNNRFINLLLFVFMPSKYRLDAHCCLRSSSKKVKILQRKYFWENLERIGEFVGDNS